MSLWYDPDTDTVVKDAEQTGDEPPSSKGVFEGETALDWRGNGEYDPGTSVPATPFDESPDESERPKSRGPAARYDEIALDQLSKTGFTGKDLGDAGIRITHHLGAEQGLTAKELLDTLAGMTDDEIRDMVDKAVLELTTTDREGNDNFDFARGYMQELYAPRPDSSKLYGIGEKPPSAPGLSPTAPALSPAAPAPTSYAAIRHDPDLLERYYRALDVYHNALGRGLTDAERTKLANDIASGALWEPLDDLRARQDRAAAERYRSQAEDYGVRHPGFPNNIVYNPTPPEWGSPTLAFPAHPATDPSLWAGSTGKSGTLGIPIPGFNPYAPNIPFRYTPPDVYPDLHWGPVVLNANTPILGGVYRSGYDAWHGSANQPADFRTIGFLPQALANIKQNSSEFFDPVRGLAGEAYPGPKNLVTSAYKGIIDAPAAYAARVIGDILHGNYSDIGRAGVDRQGAQNQALVDMTKAIWETTPYGAVGPATQAGQELWQYVLEGKSLPEIWEIYGQKYKDLDPLTKALVDIGIDPLNFAQIIGSAGKLPQEAEKAVKHVNPIEKSIKALDNIQDFADLVKYIYDQLKNLFGAGDDTSRNKFEFPASPINYLPSDNQIDAEYSMAGRAMGAPAFKPEISDDGMPTREFDGDVDVANWIPPSAHVDDRWKEMADRLPPTLVFDRGAGVAGRMPPTEVLDRSIDLAGRLPLVSVMQDRLYRAYLASGDKLPYEDWVKLIASRPMYLPSGPQRS